MTWTTPVTWAAGLVTSTMMNSHVRDQFRAIEAAWVDYSPTWSEGTTDLIPTISDGTIEGKYWNIGGNVFFRVALTIGASTTKGSGANQYRIGLPVAAATPLTNLAFGGLFLDSSTSDLYPLTCRVRDSTHVDLMCDPTTAGIALRGVNASVPVTIATGDTFTFSGVYEAA